MTKKETSTAAELQAEQTRLDDRIDELRKIPNDERSPEQNIELAAAMQRTTDLVTEIANAVVGYDIHEATETLRKAHDTAEKWRESKKK